MIKVKFWSKLLNKEVVKTFSNAEEATAFAVEKNGIIIA